MPDEIIPRTCGACKYFNLDWERGYYGDEFTQIGCRKGHWEVNPAWDKTTDLRRGLRTAETCPEYEVYVDG